MSIKALNWVRETTVGSSSAKLVLYALADCVDNDGKTWWSTKALAKFTEMSKRNILRQLKDLENIGFITREPRTRPDGGRSSDIITLVMTPGDNLSPPPCQPVTTPGDTVSPQEATFKKRKMKQEEKTKKNTDTVSYDLNGFSNMVDVLDLDDFGMWWNAYPKHTGTAQAKKAYRAARKITDAATLIRGAEAYMDETTGTDKQYIKAPANWLNEELWEDNQPEPKNIYILDGNEILMTVEQARDVPGCYLKK
jgi:hypothetical protein